MSIKAIRLHAVVHRINNVDRQGVEDERGEAKGAKHDPRDDSLVVRIELPTYFDRQKDKQALSDSLSYPKDYLETQKCLTKQSRPY